MIDVKPPEDFTSDALLGVYRDVPEEEYHSHPSLSRSVLAECARYSPIHARHKLEEGSESTSTSVTRGMALHRRVLQPSTYEDTYDVAPDECEATLASGDPCTYSPSYRHNGTWYCGTHAPDSEEDDIEVLSSDVHEDVKGMSEALKQDPDTRSILHNTDGWSELTVLFAHEPTGIPCKARLDYVFEVGSSEVAIVDLKSASSAHPDDFRRKMSRYGYWMQPPFYSMALEMATGVSVSDFLFACVESEKPYATQCYRMHPEEYDQALKRTHDLIHKMEDAIHNEEWDSYYDGVMPIGMKSYEKDRLGINH